MDDQGGGSQPATNEDHQSSSGKDANTPTKLNTSKALKYVRLRVLSYTSLSIRPLYIEDGINRGNRQYWQSPLPKISTGVKGDGDGPSLIVKLPIKCLLIDDINKDLGVKKSAVDIRRPLGTSQSTLGEEENMSREPLFLASRKPLLLAEDWDTQKRIDACDPEVEHIWEYIKKDIAKSGLSVLDYAYHKKGRSIRFIRLWLHQGFLDPKEAPKETNMARMSDLIGRLEAYPIIEPTILKITKIGKSLKGILNILEIPKDEEYGITPRIKKLLATFEHSLEHAAEEYIRCPPEGRSPPSGASSGTTPTKRTLRGHAASSSLSGGSTLAIRRSSRISSTPSRGTMEAEDDLEASTNHDSNGVFSNGTTKATRTRTSRRISFKDKDEPNNNGSPVENGRSEVGSVVKTEMASTPKLVVKLRLSSDKLHTEAQKFPHDVVALSRDGKRKSKGWGGRREKGKKLANPQGRLNPYNRHRSPSLSLFNPENKHIRNRIFTSHPNPPNGGAGDNGGGVMMRVMRQKALDQQKQQQQQQSYAVGSSKRPADEHSVEGPSKKQKVDEKAALMERLEDTPSNRRISSALDRLAGIKGARKNGYSPFGGDGPSDRPVRNRETRGNNVASKGAGNEENFHARPMVRIKIPDHLKAILVDDWENVTKNLTLVPIPCPKPVNAILDDYLEYERPKRMVANAQGKHGNSSQADILTEVVAGLREYFEKCLGRILLYKFERNQYLNVLGQMNSGEGEFAGKEIGDVYGAEHFCRLLVTLPELIAQTNMDNAAVNKLREELEKICFWLSKNLSVYFASNYEHPGPEYVESARRV